MFIVFNSKKKSKSVWQSEKSKKILFEFDHETVEKDLNG